MAVENSSEYNSEFDPARKVEYEPRDELLALQKTSIEASLNAARIALAFFDDTPPEKLELVYKADESHKTKADVEADAAMAAAIRKTFPHDAIRVEESGYHKGITGLSNEGGRHLWYGDSLDGSRPFTQKKPGWTVGIGAWDCEGQDYFTGAIVHPVLRKLMYATRGMGTHIVDLDEQLQIASNPQQVSVYNRDTLWDAAIAVDSWVNYNTLGRLKSVFDQMLESAQKGDMKNRFHLDAFGSNIAYQFDVARGNVSGTAVGLTTYIGGAHDWRCGYAPIVESGGVMLDVETGEMPTDDSRAVLFGSPQHVQAFMPLMLEQFNNYPGAA